MSDLRVISPKEAEESASAFRRFQSYLGELRTAFNTAARRGETTARVDLPESDERTNAGRAFVLEASAAGWDRMTLVPFPHHVGMSWDNPLSPRMCVTTPAKDFEVPA